MSGETIRLNPANSLETVLVSDNGINTQIDGDSSSIPISLQTDDAPQVRLNGSSGLTLKVAGYMGGQSSHVQSDWDEDSPSSDAYIRNKPKINSIALSGDQSGSDLLLQDKMEVLSQTDIEKILYLG